MKGHRLSDLKGLFNEDDEVEDVSDTKTLLSSEVKNLTKKKPRGTSPKRGESVSIEVAALEFIEGGNTLWVQGLGGTVLRIKTFNGRITSEECSTSPVSHADIEVTGDIRICIGKGERPMKLKKKKLASRLDYLSRNGFHVEDKRKPVPEKAPTSVKIVETTTGRVVSNDKPNIGNTPRAEGKKTTRDYVLQVLRDFGEVSVNRIHIEILALPEKPDLSLNAVKKSLKRLKDNNEVEQHADGIYELNSKLVR